MYVTPPGGDAVGGFDSHRGLGIEYEDVYSMDGAS